MCLASELAAVRADALGGAIGRCEIGVRGLERLQLAEEPVVLRVRDLGRVVDVVGVVGALDLLAQTRDLLGG